MPVVQNPKLYRELSVPFESAEAANAALTAFYEEVRELRKKHKITDLHLICQVSANFKDDDGEDEGQLMAVCHFGSELMIEGMTGYAFGKAHADSKARIAKATAAAGKGK